MADNEFKNCLLGGDINSEDVTILSGQNLEEFTVIAKITAEEKYKIVDSADLEGATEPYAVIIQAVNATSGDKKTKAWITGHFNKALLKVGGTDTIDQHKLRMRELGMIIKEVIGD